MKDRLTRILAHYGLNATRLADEIGVQRSGISHILSGRNLPSFDFISRILERFPEISPDWLILDRGTMLRQEVKPEDKNIDLPGAEKEQSTNGKVTNVNNPEQVLLIYKNGTFRSFFPPGP